MLIKILKKGFVLVIISCGFLVPSGPGGQKTGASSLALLLPRVANWQIVEDVQSYNPGTLYEYIDGAAEAYLSYDFKELIVAQFEGGRTKTVLTAEIYDMGTNLNAFGIYSAERFPESRFLPIGVQGYQEEGTLNFLAGRFYIKLLCYEGGEKTEELLKLFAGSIADKIKDTGGFPALLKAFPREGLVANSEKFFRSNFMGFKFLRNGFTASYRQAGHEFDGFLIEAKSAEDAEAMMNQYLGNFAKNSLAVDERPGGAHFKDRYLKNVFVARAGNHLCGLTKIEDGQEALGEKVLEAIVKALKK